MKFSGSVAAVTVALSTTANARHLAYPGPTGIVALPLDGISPVPTTPPRVHDLFRRANKDKDEEGTTVLMAPDATCGYISGRAGAAYTCGVDATCLFLTSSAGGDGAVACCDTVECNYRASCVDFNDYFQSSKCNDGCEVDAFTLKWYDALAFAHSEPMGTNAFLVPTLPFLTAIPSASTEALSTTGATMSRSLRFRRPRLPTMDRPAGYHSARLP
ncbi:hypothetical protein NM208_g15896 [Fusarium decemcellulare]|uniref:Uncharacterized protein n=1 Tax=Fusarium decemcellulare TaxID=57161 RepID=A0ACC1RCA3_9HYPO|nr:hypothetical protein NM208_g15896 [Fusarium decemcellulare]